MDIKEQFKKHVEEFVEKLESVDGVEATKEEKEAASKVLNFFIDFVSQSTGTVKIKEKAVEFIKFVSADERLKIKKKERVEKILFLYEFIKFLKEKENES